MNREQTIAHDLLSIGAVFLRPDEPFTWASGIRSPIYCDNRLTLTAPAVRTNVEEGLVDLICKYFPKSCCSSVVVAVVICHLLNLFNRIVPYFCPFVK